jgi:phosphatidylserine/phosphatidylglycerophosphate/cardiolipin synthase-like enzyme
VELIVAPEDHTDLILAALRGARRRVLVEMYMLTAPDAVSALLAAKVAGADVRVLLEPAPYGDPGANQPAFAALSAAGIDVRWIARTVGLVHAKLIVLDDTTALVMTLNLTGAGLRNNREFAAFDRDPGDVAWAETVWNADAIGGSPGPPPAGAGLLVSPLDARSRLGASIDAAAGAIQVEIEELSDADLVTRLVAARTGGVAVDIVAPAANRSPATTAALGRLAAAGATVRVLAAPTVHAKAMVVDGLRAYVGSMNFTRASLDDNREFGLLLDDPSTVARIGATISVDSATGLAFWPDLQR